MYLLFAFACLYTELHIPPLIPFSIINSISTSVISSNFTPGFFKQACHANRGAKNKQDLIHKLPYTSLKFSKTSNNNVSL